MEYTDLRVLVIRENWTGCTGLSAFNALLRLRVRADSISESEYIPLTWSRTGLKAIGRAIRPAAVHEFNSRLVQRVEQHRPDLLIAFKGQFVQRESLRTIKQLGTIPYCFYPDVSTLNHGPYLPQALPEYSWIFTTKSFGLRDLKELYGVDRASYLPHACDTDVHIPRVPLPRDVAEFGCDVSFIGSWTPKKEKILSEIVKRIPGIRLRVYGDRWGNMDRTSSLATSVAFRALLGPLYSTAISCSKINLALLSERVHGSSSGDQITSRTFHIPGAGGLMLHERTRDLLDIFKEDVHCVCFCDVGELVEKIEWLLKDPDSRQRIAAAGHSLVSSQHTWDQRVRTILDHYLSRNVDQPIGCAV